MKVHHYLWYSAGINELTYCYKLHTRSRRENGSLNGFDWTKSS